MWTIIASLIVLISQQLSTVDRAGRVAETFWAQFAAVQCKERVVQTKLRADGKVTATHAEEFDYVAFLKATNRGLSVEESRVPRGKRVEENQERFLITSGFPTLLLIFHPEFRSRFEFSETAASPGDGVRRIAFRSLANSQSISALKLKEHLYPILWNGTATVDAESGAIRRMEAVLGSPMDDLGLSELHVQVEYGPTMLSGASQAFWLPVRADISLKTPRQAWRNVHEFSDYKRFSVTTSTRETEQK